MGKLQRLKKPSSPAQNHPRFKSLRLSLAHSLENAEIANIKWSSRNSRTGANGCKNTQSLEEHIGYVKEMKGIRGCLRGAAMAGHG